MNFLARFADRRPRLVALTILSLFMFSFAAPALLRGPVDLTDGAGILDVRQLSGALAPQLTISLVLLGAVALIRWGRATGLTARPDMAGVRLSLWIMIVPFFFCVSIAYSTLTAPAATPELAGLLVSLIVLNLLVGFFEETLFRGVVLHGLRAAHGPGVAVIVSSLIFGAFHLINLAVGQDIGITIYQCINAAAIGLLLATLTLQARTLWPAILLHAIWNCYAMTGQLYVSVINPDEPPLPPESGVPWQGYILPTLLTLSAWVIWRRWQRRMARSTPPPIPSQGNLS